MAQPPLHFWILILALCLFPLITHATALITVPYRNLPGVAPELLSLDIYPAEGSGPHPVLIGIHGGGWRIGDKANGRFVDNKLDWCRKQGWVFVSINYRLSPAVHHPAHIANTAHAIAWVAKNIGKYGGDPKKLYVVGHSAGAHLAALVGADPRWLRAAGSDPAILSGVILLDGAGYDITREYPYTKGLIRTMYQGAFTDEMAVQKDASPVLQIKPGNKLPPFLIFYDEDRVDGRLQSNLLAETLQKNGYQAEAVPVADKTHATINADFGKPGDPETVKFEEFLRP